MSELPREPYSPNGKEWGELWKILCGFCAKRADCDVVEAMIEMKNGGAWPAGGWVSDPGAGVTCLSYEPSIRPKLPRQQLRQILRHPPPVCGGCAALKGSEASISLHTRRDYAAAVKTRSLFVCHEDPEHKRPCGGWCRAVRARMRRASCRAETHHERGV